MNRPVMLYTKMRAGRPSKLSPGDEKYFWLTKKRKPD